MSKVIIFPTDTVYGIGANLFDKEAIKRIYEIKGRDFNKPLAVLVSRIEALKEVAVINRKASALMERFWPGALTIILKTTTNYYNQTLEETLGVRMPNHKKALEIVETFGQGLFKTTSVNPSGLPPMNDYKEIYAKYAHLVDEIYSNEETLSEVSSTVVDLSSDDVKILRAGDISLAAILETIKNL